MALEGFHGQRILREKNIEYNKGICPVAERLQDETFLGFITKVDLINKYKSEFKQLN